ncbi:hypothetical protein Q4488_12825 [Amphritea sp. 1_MG-2023]|uniref:hypothetical protein n=1 Tax=Amphritea sp. 1_MG-2023 TaxID=3062670 RepID=UPI0026E398E5|nr:hypothetical protein [Amphritea sp. 1_MG-2023]MDO6564271.1 hypothetical protein [Amphritea sp. 1_MG-2023]
MFLGVRLAIAIAITLLASVSLAANNQLCQQHYNAGQMNQAYDYCLPLAQVGDPQAAFILARLYSLGIEGKGADWEKVVEWLTISAAGDHAEAAYNLAIAYETGKGVAVNVRQALKYYRQSVTLGNPKAMRNLARLYEQGEGVELDINRAFLLYQQSAEAGLPDSQMKTGLMLLHGEGVTKDLMTARRWIEKSAQSGYLKAQLGLGVMLMDVEPSQAVYWYQRALSKGSAYAAHNLALAYFEGRSVPLDLLRALAYADASLELGDLKTQVLYDRILTRIQQQDAAQTLTLNGSTRSNDAQKSTESHTPAQDQGYLVKVRQPSVATTDNQAATSIWQDLDWLKRQPSDGYIIQLARLTSQTSALRFIAEYHLEDQAYAVNLAKHDYVILLQDSYADKNLALNASKAKLPTALVDEAWVRSYRSLYTQ